MSQIKLLEALKEFNPSIPDRKRVMIIVPHEGEVARKIEEYKKTYLNIVKNSSKIATEHALYDHFVDELKTRDAWDLIHRLNITSETDHSIVEFWLKDAIVKQPVKGKRLPQERTKTSVLQNPPRTAEKSRETKQPEEKITTKEHQLPPVKLVVSEKDEKLKRLVAAQIGLLPAQIRELAIKEHKPNPMRENQTIVLTHPENKAAEVFHALRLANYNTRPGSQTKKHKTKRVDVTLNGKELHVTMPL